MACYAHSHPDHPDDCSRWEPLFTPFGDAPDQCQGQNGAHCQKCQDLVSDHGHLNKVAHLAATFAAEMFPPGPDRHAAKRWGHLAGLWHDLGKFSTEFQQRLRGERERADHSTAGARHVFDEIPCAGQLLAYLIAGHHAGLADWSKNGTRADLEQRLDPLTDIPNWHSAAPPALIESPALPQLAFLNPSDPAAIAFFTRLLFSCLVDADFLATEAFMNPRQSDRRPAWPADIIAMMDSALATHFKTAFGPPENEIHRQREAVRAHPFTFNFKSAAQDFQLIPDTQAPVIIEPVPDLCTHPQNDYHPKLGLLIPGQLARPEAFII